MEKAIMISELKDLFDDLEGAVVLHWSGSECEPTNFPTLGQALATVADEAIAHGMTAKEIEKIAYIVTEAEYEAQEEEYART